MRRTGQVRLIVFTGNGVNKNSIVFKGRQGEDSVQRCRSAHVFPSEDITDALRSQIEQLHAVVLTVSNDRPSENIDDGEDHRMEPAVSGSTARAAYHLTTAINRMNRGQPIKRDSYRLTKICMHLRHIVLNH